MSIITITILVVFWFSFAFAWTVVSCNEKDAFFPYLNTWFENKITGCPELTYRQFKNLYLSAPDNYTWDYTWRDLRRGYPYHARIEYQTGKPYSTNYYETDLWFKSIFDWFLARRWWNRYQKNASKRKENLSQMKNTAIFLEHAKADAIKAQEEAEQRVSETEKKVAEILERLQNNVSGGCQ